MQKKWGKRLQKMAKKAKSGQNESECLTISNMSDTSHVVHTVCVVGASSL